MKKNNWIYFLLICNLSLFAQSNEPFLFIGKNVLLSSQINASNIHLLDTTSLRLNVQFDDNYNIPELKEYRIGVLKSIPNGVLKFNYVYFQENVILVNDFKFGYQQRLSKRLIANIGLGIQSKNFRGTIWLGYSGLSLNYRLTDYLFIHSFIDEIGLGNNNRPKFMSGVIYKVDNSLGLFGQILSRNEYDFSLGGAFQIYKFRIQLSHVFIKESLEMAFRFETSTYSLSFTYSHHPILSQNVVVIFGLSL